MINRLIFIGLLGMPLLSLADFDAVETGNAPTEHQQCVINYFECKDTCQYYEDAAKVKPCEHTCGQKYPCRPTQAEMQAASKAGTVPGGL